MVPHEKEIFQVFKSCVTKAGLDEKDMMSRFFASQELQQSWRIVVEGILELVNSAADRLLFLTQDGNLLMPLEHIDVLLKAASDSGLLGKFRNLMFN